MIVLQSCFKVETYPPEPQIDMLDFTYKDTVDELDNPVLNGTLHFYFVDGDGDIGFDTTTPRENTIFIEKFKISGGQEISLDYLVPLNYYVPKFTHSGTNQTLKGEIIVNDLNEIYPFEADTIMYKFYIVDRAGNKSNTESTGYLILQ